MAITRTVRVECEGPCGGEVVEGSRIPDGWSRIKLTPTMTPPGESPTYWVATLCPACTARAHKLLEGAGFTLTQVNPPSLPTNKGKRR